MVYVVASQQNLHLAQFFKVLELMGYDWAKDLEHITFGMGLSPFLPSSWLAGGRA